MSVGPTLTPRTQATQTSASSAGSNRTGSTDSAAPRSTPGLNSSPNPGSSNGATGSSANTGTANTSTSQDRSDISSEASNSNRTANSATETRNNHLRALEDNFSIFDNPEGGESDGISGLGDFEKVAKGEYDRSKAEADLRSQGLSDKQIKERLESVEDTAQYFLDDTESREFVDSANDGEGNSDGKIGRQDLDKAMLEVEQQERDQKSRDAQSGTTQLSEKQRAEAQQTIARWQQPEALNQELQQRPLSEFSQAELTALAAVSEDNPEIQAQLEEAVNKSVVSSESLDELPDGEAYQYLLNKYVTGREVPEDKENRKNDPTVRSQGHLDGLTGDAVKESLDEHLEGRKGDSELESAQERISSDLESLALENPALAESIQSQAESKFEEYSDKFTEVGRADDNWLQKTTHAVTGGVRDGVSFVTDGFRKAVDVGANIATYGNRIAGDIGNLVIDSAGQVAGAGLDALGAEGVADNVRNGADKVGDAIDSGANFLADQQGNFINGLGESVAGGVDGVVQTVTDPLGTVKGIAAVVKDPSLLVDAYKQKIEEQGVAGVAGELVGDVAIGFLTGGGTGASKGASIAGKIGGTLDKVGDLSKFGTLGTIASKGIQLGSRGVGAVESVLGKAGQAGGLKKLLLDESLGSLGNLGGKTGAVAGKVEDFLSEAAQAGGVKSHLLNEGLRGLESLGEPGKAVAGAIDNARSSVQNAYGDFRTVVKSRGQELAGEGLQAIGLEETGKNLASSGRVLAERRAISKAYNSARGSGADFVLDDSHLTPTELEARVADKDYFPLEEGQVKINPQVLKESLSRLDGLDNLDSLELLQGTGIDAGVEELVKGRAEVFEALTGNAEDPRDVARKFRNLGSDAGRGGAVLVPLQQDTDFARFHTEKNGLKGGSLQANLASEVEGFDSHQIARGSALSEAPRFRADFQARKGDNVLISNIGEQRWQWGLNTPGGLRQFDISRSEAAVKALEEAAENGLAVSEIFPSGLPNTELVSAIYSWALLEGTQAPHELPE